MGTTSRTTLDSFRARPDALRVPGLLVSESIRSKSRLANPDSAEADTVGARRTAGAMELIEMLPDGLDARARPVR